MDLLIFVSMSLVIINGCERHQHNVSRFNVSCKMSMDCYIYAHTWIDAKSCFYIMSKLICASGEVTYLLIYFIINYNFK